MVAVLAPKSSSRLSYTLEQVLKRWLGLTYTVYYQANEIPADMPVINYGLEAQGPSERLYLPCNGLLFEEGIKPMKLESWPQGQPLHSNDPLAAIFFALSRYEEYQVFGADQHGRFSASNTKCPFRYPYIDQLVEEIRQKINQQWGWQLAPPPFEVELQFDIDNAFAFRGKGLKRSFLSLARDLLRRDSERLGKRLRTWQHPQADPNDVYQQIRQVASDFGLRPRLFFLLGNYGPYDKNLSHRSPLLQQTIQQVAQWADIGLHPSYASNHQPQKIAEEKARLEAITGQNIGHSRQHYLMLRFPETYQNLLQAGIEADHSLGFADAPGFRAGTSRPFRWYDLSREQETPLTLYPFSVMDTPLYGAQGWSPKYALQEIEDRQISKLRQLGGRLALLFHNETLSQMGPARYWHHFPRNLLAQALQP